MFAAHDQQENLVHAQQAAAAAKPLNQGLKQFTAKTPGNKAPKTPFKVALNDENAVAGPGKSVAKANGKARDNLLRTSGLNKKGDAEKDAFVTPAGPRTARAPLGAKTTNAKAKPLQTPAPNNLEPGTEKTNVKSRSPRLRRPAKLKVLQADPEAASANLHDEEPDVEYMPPRGVPLPDFDDDDVPAEVKYPMLAGKNLTRGWASTYLDPLDDDDVPLSRKRAAENKVRADAYADRMMAEAFGSLPGPGNRTKRPQSPGKKNVPKKQNEPAKKPPAGHQRTGSTQSRASRADTATSRAAAAALAQPNANPNTSVSHAAPPKPRGTAGFLRPRKQAAPEPPANAARRHALATAASRTTLGYAKGRDASSNLRKPVRNITRGLDALPGTSEPVAINPRALLRREDSEMTITPARYAERFQQAEEEEDEVVRDLRAMDEMMRCGAEDDGVEEEVTAALRGRTEEDLGGLDDELEDFQFDVPN